MLGILLGPATQWGSGDRMVRLLLRILVQLIANAVGLIVAAAVLDDMSLESDGFLIAVGVFTLVNVLTLPLIQKQAITQSSALMGSTALVAALVALIVTTIVSDGLTIDGLSTWLLATVIVWGASLVATLILPLWVFKSLREDRNR
jgi:putative membrane protein